MTLDLDDLELRAKAATPGEWFATFGCAVFADGYNPIADTFQITGDIGQPFLAPWPHASKVANAAFIAAANPTAVLALIARVRELEAELREAQLLQRDTTP